ncbi:MAG: serine/threonine protein kinase [Chloroflexi bacterium]|nr:serine/threonine protein kinase [Chloroflexota bacterium]
MKQIKQYQIKEEIGRGGMSTVYRAIDPTHERTVAIKLMHERLNENKRAHERFFQEAEMVMALQHPAIVPVIEYGEVNGRLFIIMQFMAGGSIRQKLDSGPIPLEECQEILAQIAPGLDATHAQNIIHRDIKPHNILLDKEGHAYLSDFGVARLSQDEGEEQTVTLVGTPEFIAPEQVNEGQLTWQTDIYQLGVTLFHMLTGQLPFSGSSMQIMSQHLTKAIPSAEVLNPALPAGIDRVLQRAMAKESQARYLSAGDLVEALTALGNEATITELFSLPPHLQPADVSSFASTAVSHPIPTVEPANGNVPVRMKRSLRAIIGGVAMAAVVGVLLFALANFPQAEESNLAETAVIDQDFVEEENEEAVETAVSEENNDVTNETNEEAANVAESENNNPPPPPPPPPNGDGNGNGRPRDGGRPNDGDRRGGGAGG